MMRRLFQGMAVVSFLLLLTLEALTPGGPECMAVECGRRSIPPVNTFSQAFRRQSVSDLAKTSGAQAFIGVVTNTADAIIRGVIEGSPAAKAGLRTGDVVLDIAGYPVHTGADLWTGLQRIGAGTSVRIRVVRNQDVLERCLATATPGTFARE